MPGAKTSAGRPGLFRVLISHRSRELFEQAEEMQGVQSKIPEKMFGGNPKSDDDPWDIGSFPPGQFTPIGLLPGPFHLRQAQIGEGAVYIVVFLKLGAFLLGCCHVRISSYM